MAGVFISYSSEDRKFAERLARDLKKRDHIVWYADWEIKVGDSLTAKINAGIRENDYLTIILSCTSVQSEWVRREVDAALIKELKEKRVVVLPVLLEDCEIPPLLSDKVYADFRKSYQQGLKKLLASLPEPRTDMLADERLQSPIPIYPQPPSTLQARIELEFPKAILSKRRLDDPDSPHFGNNPEANRMPMPHRECTHEQEDASDSRVILSALPLVERTIQIPVSEALRQWLEPNQRRYDLDPGGLFLPIEGCKPRLDGILCEERLDLERNRYKKYLLILESGYVEMGEVLAYHSRNRTYFAFTPIIARLWQFINFVLDLYGQHAGEGQFIVILNMINTLGSMLALLGKGWMEPGIKDVFDRTFDPATSNRNIQIASAPLGIDLQPEDISTLVRQIAQRVDYAYGVWNLRAFNHPNFGDPSSLNLDHIRLW